MAVNMISENKIEPALTFGETLFSVVISPNTVQGWRPISVIIHPDVLAMNGAEMPSKDQSEEPLAGLRPFAQRSATPVQSQQNHDAAGGHHNPKLQNVVRTGGI